MYIFPMPTFAKSFYQQYKIELRIRNHNTVKRMALIEELAKSVPEEFVVDLENPELFILVEVFKVWSSATP